MAAVVFTIAGSGIVVFMAADLVSVDTGLNLSAMDMDIGCIIADLGIASPGSVVNFTAGSVASSEVAVKPSSPTSLA